MKRSAEKDEAIVRIPPVVGIAVVVVEPTLAVIAVDVEDVAVPGGVVLHGASPIPPPLEYSPS
jgi:hypothetical protein